MVKKINFARPMRSAHNDWGKYNEYENHLLPIDEEELRKMRSTQFRNRERRERRTGILIIGTLCSIILAIYFYAKLNY
ncbi:hypothetical protein NEF87_001673 [Candidatus Lokiarchaeum ossiferum]|uniref:Riboflavin synthase subunit beta n=1 Tax=Candidatus Lokiarchaeum ossiferum TaxID=2951803 RepID=A0ABY6HPE2_9ARCH|nr:hypothetical protein NEF87_001673 [Candidatus Lokiarchaeum sp. B-35]